MWPEFCALSNELKEELAALTDRVIHEAIHEDTSEAADGDPKALPKPNAPGSGVEE